MRGSLWRPLSLLNACNLCGLRKVAIKQNDLEKLQTHCPKLKQLELMTVPVDDNAALLTLAQCFTRLQWLSLALGHQSPNYSAKASQGDCPHGEVETEKEDSKSPSDT